MRDVHDRAVQWIVSDDTGMSSKAIWAHMMYAKRPSYCWHHPYDPDDLGRCLRLLRLIPEWKSRIKEMATRSKEWGFLVTYWDNLAAMMDAECGIDWEKKREARDTYFAMKRVLKGEPL